MPSGTRTEIDYNKVYHSNNCGDFVIVEELKPKIYNNVTKRVVLVRFLDTNYECSVNLIEALKGIVKDPYAKNILGIACIGPIDRSTVSQNEYNIWYGMIRRCCCKESDSYSTYGGAGVTVCPEWLCLANFINDLPSLPGYYEFKARPNGAKYQLDKDLKQRHLPKNQRVYSKETCMFIPETMNNQIKIRDHKVNTNCSSQYIGLYRTPHNTFQCHAFSNGIKYYIGTFKDEIAAANAYNWYALNYNVGYGINQVPYMSPVEWGKYKSGVKKMCSIVKK